MPGYSTADIYDAARASGVPVLTAARIAAMTLPMRPHGDWNVARDLAKAISGPDGVIGWLALDPPCSPRTEEAARAWFASHLGSKAVTEIELTAAGG